MALDQDQQTEILRGLHARFPNQRDAIIDAYEAGNLEEAGNALHTDFLNAARERAPAV